MQTNIDYLTKCIEDCQTAIMQLEDDNFSTDQHFSLLDTEEAMYIMNKLVNTAVNYAITASQKEEELKEKDARLNSLWNDNAYSNHLLNYMVAKTNFVSVVGGRFRKYSQYFVCAVRAAAADGVSFLLTVYCLHFAYRRAVLFSFFPITKPGRGERALSLQHSRQSLLQ